MCVFSLGYWFYSTGVPCGKWEFGLFFTRWKCNLGSELYHVRWRWFRNWFPLFFCRWLLWRQLHLFYWNECDCGWKWLQCNHCEIHWSLLFPKRGDFCCGQGRKQGNVPFQYQTPFDHNQPDDGQSHVQQLHHIHLSLVKFNTDTTYIYVAVT